MLNAAIIGPGNIAHTYMQALENSSKIKFTAALGRSIESTSAFAHKYNIKGYTDSAEMYNTENLDAVLICTPTFTHEDFVREAIENGVHVMCEKPFVLSADTADNLFSFAEEKGVRIMVMQVVRFWPENAYIKQLIDSGRAGEVTNVYANRLSAHPDWCSWHKDPQKSGGGLYDLHIHDIDYMYHLFGKVKSVYAVGMQTDTGCWNNVSTIMNFECGVKAVVEGFMDITGEWSFSTDIRINSKKMAIEYLNKRVYNSKATKEKVENLVIYHKYCAAEIANVPQYNPYRAEAEYFADCVAGDKPTDIVPCGDVVYVLRILSAIEKSLKTGLVQYID